MQLVSGFMQMGAAGRWSNIVHFQSLDVMKKRQELLTHRKSELIKIPSWTTVFTAKKQSGIDPPMKELGRGFRWVWGMISRRADKEETMIWFLTRLSHNIDALSYSFTALGDRYELITLIAWILSKKQQQRNLIHDKK